MLGFIKMNEDLLHANTLQSSFEQQYFYNKLALSFNFKIIFQNLMVFIHINEKFSNYNLNASPSLSSILAIIFKNI